MAHQGGRDRLLDDENVKNNSHNDPAAGLKTAGKFAMVFILICVVVAAIKGKLNRMGATDLDELSMNCIKHSPFYFRVGCVRKRGNLVIDDYDEEHPHAQDVETVHWNENDNDDKQDESEKDRQGDSDSDSLPLDEQEDAEGSEEDQWIQKTDDEIDKTIAEIDQLLSSVSGISMKDKKKTLPLVEEEEVLILKNEADEDSSVQEEDDNDAMRNEMEDDVFQSEESEILQTKEELQQEEDVALENEEEDVLRSDEPEILQTDEEDEDEGLQPKEELQQEEDGTEDEAPRTDESEVLQIEEEPQQEETVVHLIDMEEPKSHSNRFNWDKMPSRLIENLERFKSDKCKMHRSRVSGDANTDELGKYGRAKCVDGNRTDNFKSERGSQVVVSDDYRVIYVPSMKAASVTFKNIMSKRFNGKVIGTHLLEDHLAAQNVTINDYLVFTFVRDPVNMFFSAYAEIDKRFQKSKPYFQKFNRTIEHEPKRAIGCLNMVRRGSFKKRSMTPKFMFSQVWKTQRCIQITPNSTLGQEIEFDFIGNLENVKEDYEALEDIIGVPHVPLKRTKPPRVNYKQHVQMVKNQHFPLLEQAICDYFEADYDCLQYEKPDSCK